MKKLFITLLLFFPFLIFSQTINWGTTTKTLESFSYNWNSKSGTYVGNIEGFDYYVYYRRVNSPTSLSNKMNMAFVKVKNNQVIQFTEFTKKEYLKINIQIMDNKIAVIYLELSRDSKSEVKIDFFDPNLLTFEKSKSLYSFYGDIDYNSFGKFAVSEDKNTTAIMTFAKMPETKQSGILIKTFDNQYNEKDEIYIQDESKFYCIYDQLIVNNDGSGYVVASNYRIENQDYYLDEIDVIKFNESNYSTIKYKEENLNDEMSATVIQTGKEEAKLVLTKKKILRIIDLDFGSENFSESNFYEFKSGDWMIDKVIKLENGNLFFSLANQGMRIITSSNSRTIVYFNKSFMFYCFDASMNELIYELKSGRYYTVNEGIPSPEGYLTVPTFYYQKDNKVTLLYNSDEEYPEEHTDKNGNDDPSITTSATKTSLLQKTVIDETGFINTTTLTNSSDEDGLFATPFIHVTEDGKILIAKINNKKITIGTIQ
jgi:hypothetical protein